MEYKSVKHAVKALQAQADLTQEQLADRIDVCRAALSRTINKPDHRITSDLLPIAQALGCKLELHFIREKDGETVAVIPYPPDLPEKIEK